MSIEAQSIRRIAFYNFYENCKAALLAVERKSSRQRMDQPNFLSCSEFSFKELFEVSASISCNGTTNRRNLGIVDGCFAIPIVSNGNSKGVARLLNAGVVGDTISCKYGNPVKTVDVPRGWKVLITVNKKLVCLEVLSSSSFAAWFEQNQTSSSNTKKGSNASFNYLYFF